ncbi:hypothetical protein DU508_10435 [Pedobacter chinensis]|uniref:Uncharacterized protein n=1 Tax=Pedobacter chinensis TaxID=2282421 RepID=A0A369PZA7_9SPHI|nr:hypothetical protein [Pedobacter chinensis]RDC56039.1 hypothetical protein DU508_10435 [Pedobacter chinensis]
MTKTSTSKTNVNLPTQSMFQPKTDIESDTEISLFYEQIKSKLDGLAKNPQDETINKILAYSRSK